MFSQQICRYSLGNFTIEILKSVKFIKFKGIIEAQGLGIWRKIFLGGRELRDFKYCIGVAWEGW